jgi:hypothetical protein
MFTEIYERKISEAYGEIYISILEESPIEQIELALQRLLVGKTFTSYPTPGEFIRYMQDDRSSPEIQATLAFEEVTQMCKIASDGDSVEFDDPAISRTVEILGGWPQVYQIIVFDKDKLSILHSQFHKTYERFYKAKVGNACKLPGVNGMTERIKRLPNHRRDTKQLPEKSTQAERATLTPTERKIIEDGDGALF